jgi:uncharacterized membrane protein
MTEAREARRLGSERLIGRTLIALTYVSVGLLVVGVALMLGAGISPVAGGPGLDVATLGARIAALDADGFLWLGLLAVIAAPIGRVLLAAVAYARGGDWGMVGVAVAILSIIVVGVATAGAATV